MRGFEVASIRNAAAQPEDDVAQLDAHRHFDQSGVLHASGKREHLRAFALFGADTRIPRSAFANDGRDVRVSFDVVDQRGRSPQSFLCRIRRPGSWRATLTFHGINQSCLFAADKRTRAQANVDAETEPSFTDVVPQQPEIFCLLDAPSLAA